MAKTKKNRPLSKIALFKILRSSLSMVDELYNVRFNFSVCPLYREHAILMRRLYFCPSNYIVALQPTIIDLYNRVNSLYLEI